MRKVIKLANNNDFVIISEAHCVGGRADALRLPAHLCAFWSDGTASTAGIGLVLQRDFLSNFSPIDPEQDWVEVIPGRVAILHLRGGMGALDIVCVYLPTGDETSVSERKSAITQLSEHIQPKDEVLTVISGDFNFVEGERDRYCTDSGEWTGLKDSSEADLFREHIRSPHGMFELEQNQFTCEAGGARSRIDRMYCNQHLSYQLDKHMACNVLEWEKSVSVHRAIVFSRRTPQPKDPESKPIPTCEFHKEGWKEKVVSQFGYLCRGDRAIANPVRRLLLLKDAIRNVHQSSKEDLQSEEDQACSPDDKLGYTMSCIRAIDCGRHALALKFAKAYPKLMEWIPAADQRHTSIYDITSIRNHALELARQQIQDEINSINLGTDDPADKSRAKETVLRKLKRLSPGENQGISAMVNDAGSVSIKPEDIAEILRKHWQGVFSEKAVRTNALQIWMEELFLVDDRGCYITGLPDGGDRVWSINRKAIKQAISSAKNSMPGPDGISSAAYKALGDFGVDLLFAVTHALCQQGQGALLTEAYSDRCEEQRHDFNLSLLCCLPKKPYGTDPDQGEYYRGEDTRPLALVNTDNRIIASAARITWEPILSKYISAAQQGFLKGRQMLNNIIDIDYDSMKVSLQCARGALILFDFKAAFPSVAPAFLRASLSAIGLPEHAINLIDALYHQNRCNISHQGQLYKGFDMLCGVRQGCPISPLLFAASVDVLLRMLQKRVPGGMFRAFADDIGAVLPDWDQDSVLLESIFQEFSEMSGLDLNIEKTICIPLWEKGQAELESTLRESGRAWSNIKLAEEGTYLGFSVGPSRCGKSWQKPLHKFLSRCESWGRMGLGLMFSTIAYNTFASSTLAFVAQLAEPEPGVFAAEKKGITKMLPGPGNWCQEQDAFYLKELYGQKYSFRSMHVVARAAKVRVKYMHDCYRRRESNLSTISIHSMAQNIRRYAEGRCSYPDRVFMWKQWYESSFPIVLDSNEELLRKQHDIKVEAVLLEIAARPPPWEAQVRLKQKKLLQKSVSSLLHSALRPDPKHRLRTKLGRWFEITGAVAAGWGLAGPPAHIASRVLRHLQRLPDLVAPRVCAAVFRTIFNGWVTHRRFDKRQHQENRCMLGCVGEAEDSIEHYCRCPALQQVLCRRLRVSVPCGKGLSFWVLNEEYLSGADGELLTCSALINYGGYMATNHFRKRGRAPNTETAVNAINQFITQSALGHTPTGTFLDNRWAKHIKYIV